MSEIKTDSNNKFIDPCVNNFKQAGAATHNNLLVKKKSKSMENRSIFAALNSGGIIDTAVKEVLLACGSADEASKLRLQVFPEWRCTSCSSPSCNGNMQENVNLHGLVFVQNPLVADVRSVGASNLVAGLNTKCINVCLAKIIII